MTIYEAIEADKMGYAEGLTKDGLVRAQVFGPHWSIGRRKKAKMLKNITLTVYTPPLRGGPFRSSGTGPTRSKLKDLSNSVRGEIMRLNWQPKDPRDVVSRLADLL